ncbi:MAG: hypothetical protein QGH33_16345 [Pirellulaceae bacterium]|nr:hypothetical protein [Pirellulaceae bacterium]MDP7302968.1 hypothetical protein [Pirellulaceae bacterium]
MACLMEYAAVLQYTCILGPTGWTNMATGRSTPLTQRFAALPQESGGRAADT